MKQVLSFLAFLTIWFPYNQSSAQQTDSFLKFINDHRSNSAFYLIRNDTIAAALNENEMMPLAGTMNIMVAVEFAKQAAFKVFDTSKMISLKELNKYYIPLTDGNAHPQWLAHEQEQGHVVNDSIALICIARGMMAYNSDANTEYLMDMLGLQNVNGNYRLMGIQSFTPLYYPVSSLFLYQNPQNMKEEKVIEEAAAIPTMDYIKACNIIHEQLKNDTTYKAKFNLNDLTATMQREWSRRLPASTAKAYAQIGYVLNNQKIFEAGTYQILSKVLESSEKRAGSAYAGITGGSTMFVLAKMFYATLNSGTKIAMAYFLNNLNPANHTRLNEWANDFESGILTDPTLSEKLRQF